MTRLRKLIILVGDVLTLYLALVIMILLRYDMASFSDRLTRHLLPFSIVFIVWIIIFYLAGLYRFKIRLEGDLFWSIFTSVIISSVASIIIFYLLDSFFHITPKTNLILFSAIFFILNYIWRAIILRVLVARTLNVIILGHSSLMDEAIAHIQNNSTEYNIVTWIKDFKENDISELSRTIKNTKLHLAVIQPHLKSDIATMRLVYRLMPLKIILISFWDFYEMLFKKVPLDELKESWFIENIAMRRLLYDVPKRLIDFIFAIIAGIILLPLIFSISILIKLISKGTVIYRQKRVGKNRVEFILYKFRTMQHNNSGPYWTEPKDQRVTFIGRYLRLTHLDEIPQLFNIIRGDLSIVGPRPERLELAEKYKNLPYYNIRHVAVPGLTGWAQINYRPSASLEEAHEKLRYDIFYIKNRSHFLDLLIIFKTIKYFIKRCK